jgi:hypothetical protein
MICDMRDSIIDRMTIPSKTPPLNRTLTLNVPKNKKAGEIHLRIQTKSFNRQLPT